MNISPAVATTAAAAKAVTQQKSRVSIKVALVAFSMKILSKRTTRLLNTLVIAVVKLNGHKTEIQKHYLPLFFH